MKKNGIRQTATNSGARYNTPRITTTSTSRKDLDELKMLRRANDANARMYAVAREIIEPGINELDLYNQLHAVAVRELGEACHAHPTLSEMIKEAALAVEGRSINF